MGLKFLDERAKRAERAERAVIGLVDNSQICNRKADLGLEFVDERAERVRVCRPIVKYATGKLIWA